LDQWVYKREENQSDRVW